MSGLLCPSASRAALLKRSGKVGDGPYRHR